VFAVVSGVQYESLDLIQRFTRDSKSSTRRSSEIRAILLVRRDRDITLSRSQTDTSYCGGAKHNVPVALEAFPTLNSGSFCPDAVGCRRQYIL